MGLFDMLTELASAANVSGQHFDQVAQNAPKDVIAAGLAGVFRSDQTPAIGQLVGQLFGNSNGSQQAGMINQILAALGPVAAASLGGGVLGSVMSPGASQVTPDQAARLSPEQVQAVVDHAHQINPGIADGLASFYAQHSDLIKTLGGAALGIAMAKMKEHVSQA